MVTSKFSIFGVFLCGLIMSIGQLFLKLGSKNLSFSFEIIKNHYLLLGVFFYVLAVILLIISFKFGELSILYPILSLSFVWTTILSFTILNESMNIFKIIAIIFIVFGVSLISRNSKTKKRIQNKNIIIENTNIHTNQNQI